MLNFFKKPFAAAIFYGALLTAFTAYVMLDTFVIPKEGKKVENVDFSSIFSSTSATTTAPDDTSVSTTTHGTESSENTTAGTTPEQTSTEQTTVSVEPVITDNSYTDANISIRIDTIREYDTQIYVADIQLSSAEYLKSAFANNTYGRNMFEATSSMAESHNAIFAINGDFCGFRDYGFVLRNGELYRSVPANTDAMVIYADGTFDTIDQNSTDINTLVENGAYQILSFGPTLIKDGDIVVDKNDEVAASMSSNPRTAIGMIDKLHYIVIVSDGRTNESAGLSLLELAEVFDSYGCSVAYNLDGGGSATMWFNGKVQNVLTNGKNDSERWVSDIVYIGYEY